MLTEARTSCLEEINTTSRRSETLRYVSHVGKLQESATQTQCKLDDFSIKRTMSEISKLVLFEFITVGGFQWVAQCVAQLLFTSAFSKRFFFFQRKFSA